MVEHAESARVAVREDASVVRFGSTGNLDWGSPAKSDGLGLSDLPVGILLFGVIVALYALIAWGLYVAYHAVT